MNVSIDSRLIKKGDYFVAVKGENFDGHDFINKAMENGASGVLEEDELYKLAKIKLNKVKPKVIAITGSLGKSTTRKFIAETLSSKYKVAEGNLNTKLGLAVNIMNNVDQETQYFVAECGMDKIDELAKTGKFLNPDVVVLTNISESHMEKLGSLENIIRAKAELLEQVKSSGKVYLNWTDNNSKKTAEYSNTKNIVKVTLRNLKILPDKINILGQHNLMNLVFAYMIGVDEGIKKSALNNAVKKIKLPKGRLNQFRGINGSILIDDTYNASPKSTINALQAVSDYYINNFLKGRKIAVLGGMLELGKYEDEGHQIAGQEIINQKYDVVLLVGELANKFNSNNQISNSNIECINIEGSINAGKYLKKEVRPLKEDIILFKASQGIRLEKAIPFIMKNPEEARKLLVRQDARWI